MINIAFFDTKPYDRKYFDKALLDSYNKIISIKYFSPRLSKETVKLAQGFNVVCAFVNDVIDADVVNSLYEFGIKLIALRCAGYNNVDLKSVFNKIHVVRVPEYSPYAVAEHTVALMLALNRKTHRAYYRTRDLNFSINGLLGFDMHNKTAGIIGTGKIGICVIKILKGFGMNILAYDVFPNQNLANEIGFKYVDLKELYKNSDIISLHCPLSQETVYMINKEAISLMKKGVMIINTGRGKLINTKDLINGLKTNHIGCAGLDVYEEESEYFFEDHSSKVLDDDILARLLTFPNVLITSHQAFFTHEALNSIAETTLNNIKLFYEKNELPNEICYKCSAGKQNCRKKEQGKCF